jgi:hypothetical protein
MRSSTSCQKRSRFLPAACLAALLLSAVGAARGDIVLSVSDPTGNGIEAVSAGTAVFTPATENPAHANADGVRAALNQMGDQLIFSGDIDGNSAGGFLASTGIGPEEPYFGSIPILISGTAGEPNGTPVNLSLSSNFSASGKKGSTWDTVLILNDVAYSPSITYNIPGLKVGDTFNYWASLGGSGELTATMQSILGVQSGPVGPPVPEPGDLALAGALGVSLFGFLWRARRMRSPSQPGGRAQGAHTF